MYSEYNHACLLQKKNEQYRRPTTALEADRSSFSAPKKTLFVIAASFVFGRKWFIFVSPFVLKFRFWRTKNVLIATSLGNFSANDSCIYLFVLKLLTCACACTRTSEHYVAAMSKLLQQGRLVSCHIPRTHYAAVNGKWVSRFLTAHQHS